MKENPEAKWILVDDDSQQTDFLNDSQAHSSTPWIAIDSERASGFKYNASAYLVQVRFGGLIDWLIDPMAFTEDTKPMLLPPEIRQALNGGWILHSATQDLPCLKALGLEPKAIFDTELAARLLGLPRVGLAGLLEDLMGITLAKEHSAADWSKRPLSEAMLEYAALDVRHLHGLQEILWNQLESRQRTDWAQQEFDNLLSFTAKKPDSDKWYKLAASSRSKDEALLSIVKSLWQAREKLAEDLDLSPGRVLPDRAIMAAANHKPKTKGELARLKEFVGRFSRSKLDLWWDAIEGSAGADISRTPQEQTIPSHRSWERKFPEAHLRLAEARVALTAVALENGIALDVLLQPATLRAVCFPAITGPVDLSQTLLREGARPWQINLVRDELASSLGLNLQ